jgi:flagellar biosynthesis/type III secretory pathway protein FliH
MADRARALEAAEGQLIELVKVICRRVLSRELERNPLLIEGLVHAGLEALGGGDRVTVRLGPFFAETVEPLAELMRQKGIKCMVLLDPSVGRHGCQLETELGRVDESLETRLNVLLSALDVAP